MSLLVGGSRAEGSRASPWGRGLSWGVASARVRLPLTALFALQPFRCAHCHYSCNISGSLKRHYNRKHPNEEYANVGGGELAADALVQQGK